MSLKIAQTWAQIGIRSSLPQLKLQIREPKLEIKGTLSAVQIEQQDTQVKCDATQCRAEIGLRTPLAFSRHLAQQGFKDSLAYIGQVARNGDMMARIDKYDISAVMVQLGSQAFEEQQFNFTRLPQSPVRVEVIPGELQVNWQMGQLQIQPQNGDIMINPIRGEVQVFLRQQASIDIEASSPTIDTYR